MKGVNGMNSRFGPWTVDLRVLPGMLSSRVGSTTINASHFLSQTACIATTSLFGSNSVQGQDSRFSPLVHRMIRRLNNRNFLEPEYCQYISFGRTQNSFGAFPAFQRVLKKNLADATFCPLVNVIVGRGRRI